MPYKLKTATNIALIVNIFLFIIKAVIGILSNSIAVISEAVNSLTDIISSIAIRYAVKLSSDKPDAKHNFGHRAAQPIAAFIVAVFAFVVGINIIEESINRILSPQSIDPMPAVYVVLLVTIITKVLLSAYQRKVGRIYQSPAVKAAAVDSLNDILASAIALLGIIGVSLGYNFIDGIAGILVALFIFKTGYEVGKQNLDYLMGKSAEKELIDEISIIARKVNGVVGLNDIRSHYVGDKFHIEIHIEVDKNLATKFSHDIGNQVRFQIENHDLVQKVFVHIDPV
ncbi:hypothetical protein APF79_12190 [bacterium BRH_c32]|nr:MAG: hypothetical protein APF79_12190 [bacterium BRH_c32]